MQEPVEVDVNMTERMGGERARTHLGNCGVASGYCHRAKEFHFSKALFTSVVFFFNFKNK